MLFEELCDELLLRIIRKISLKGRFRLEEVSRRWRNVIWNSWKYVTFVKMRNYTNRQGCLDEQLTVEAAEAIWKRCGSCLQSISFYGLEIRPLFLERILTDLITYLPQCRRIQFGILRSACLNRMEALSSFNRLEDLSISVHEAEIQSLYWESDEVDESLSRMFERLKNLKRLDLAGSCGVKLECLQNLPERIQYLNISSCSYGCFEDIQLENAFCGRSRESLKELHMSGILCKSLSLHILTSFAPKLTVLNVAGCRNLCNFNALAELINLQSLNLAEVFVKQQSEQVGLRMMKALVSPDCACRTKLKTFYLQQNVALSEQCLCLLGGFSMLSQLDISGMDAVTSKVMRAICFSCPMLQSLSLQLCHNLDDVILEFVTKNCSTLKIIF